MGRKEGEKKGEQGRERRKQEEKEKVLKRFVKLTLNDHFSLPQMRVLSLRKRYLKQTFKEYQHSKEV